MIQNFAMQIFNNYNKQTYRTLRSKIRAKPIFDVTKAAVIGNFQPKVSRIYKVEYNKTLERTDTTKDEFR